MKNKHYTMLENAGRGPCDIMRKPLNICFRNDNWKFIYSELTALEGEESYHIELYEIKVDNSEVYDVSHDMKNKPLVDMFIKMAQSRCLEVRNK
jgi:hypothetical protein